MACSYTIFLKCQLYPQTNSNLCWNRKAGWPVPRPAWIWGLKRLSLGQEESKKNNFLLLHGEPQEPEPGSVLPKEVVQMWADWAAQKQDQDHTHTCHPTIGLPTICLPSLKHLLPTLPIYPKSVLGRHRFTLCRHKGYMQPLWAGAHPCAGSAETDSRRCKQALRHVCNSCNGHAPAHHNLRILLPDIQLFIDPRVY